MFIILNVFNFLFSTFDEGCESSSPGHLSISSEFKQESDAIQLNPKHSDIDIWSDDDLYFHKHMNEVRNNESYDSQIIKRHTENMNPHIKYRI